MKAQAHARDPQMKARSWIGRTDRGFTLIELVLVGVIVGILALIALPAYQKQMAKGRRADAITALSAIVQAQERWRSNRGNYASSLGDEGLKLGTQSAGKHYELSLVGIRQPPSFAFGYIAKAVPDSNSVQARDSQCAEMSIRVDGGNIQYEAKDSNAADAKAQCWPQ
ncbi:type IV pilin protein [Paucibacter sp. Y2R2-4]|uniref:type IV pilin protein n=1 Tax=Paucibacter sp. Y2R2-4 TaxID=2893553 RepID=UPI00296200AC|nr:type IV pilin protein [Paucibacter sp. Y2R2-4]